MNYIEPEEWNQYLVIATHINEEGATPEEIRATAQALHDEDVEEATTEWNAFEDGSDELSIYNF
jgi:hypothetical protein